MLPFITKKSNIKLKILAWYQIIGGVVGFLGVCWIISSIDKITWSIFVLILLILTLYSFSIYSGWLLFKDKCIFGLKLSIINQYFQILALTFVRFTYFYAAGMYLFVTVDTANGFNLGLKYYLGSEATISFHNEEKPFFLGVNLIALILIGFITKLRDSIKQEKETFNELGVSDGSHDERSADEH
jgi:hypothetical protein